MSSFVAALGLVFVLEGIFPFLYPAKWRRWLFLLCQQEERVLRRLGFVSMAIGVIILTIWHTFT